MSSRDCQFRPYLQYLLRLSERRAAGELPALSEVHDEKYWQTWRKQHGVPRRRNRTARTELRKRGD
jgi:hypothetical protein